MDSKEKDLKTPAEEGKALELDDLDQVTGGAGLGGHDAVLNPGRPNVTSGIVNQVTSGVVGHDVFSTKGIGLSDETEGATNSTR